jgi:hypothetical protein
MMKKVALASPTAIMCLCIVLGQSSPIITMKMVMKALKKSSKLGRGLLPF